MPPKKTIKKKTGLKAEKSKPSFNLPSGFYDLYSGDNPVWDKIFDLAREIARYYNFYFVQTPVVETVDVGKVFLEDEAAIDKELLNIRGGRQYKMVLRPTLTGGLMRSYVTHNLTRSQPQKLFNIGPAFQRGVKGDIEQFYNFDAEIIGESYDPVYDAQIINLFYRFLESLKIKNLMIQLNSIGCHNCRPGFIKKLAAHYKEANVCKECNVFKDKNPIYLLRCVDEDCEGLKKGAPSIFDNLCSA